MRWIIPLFQSQLFCTFVSSVIFFFTSPHGKLVARLVVVKAYCVQLFLLL
jgi:hypothetical protein